MNLRWLVKFITVMFFGVILCGVASPKETPMQVVVWPATGQPVVRLSFSKFREAGSSGSQHAFLTDVTAENLWNKKITLLEFSIYAYDKNRVRIGDAWITLSDVAIGGVVKFQTGISASGNIVSLELVPKALPPELQGSVPPKMISITVNSVPQGAELKIDGNPSGTTPKIVQVLPGKHTLTFSKEGFNSGNFPLEITPEDVSGGSVSYELGSSVHDTIELRDGSVMSVDVLSMSAKEIVIRAGGNVQNLDRNQVKRILLTPREKSTQ